MNGFQTVVAPDADDGAVWINQDAWFTLANFNAGNGGSYRLNRDGNGVYLFVIEGAVTIADEHLERRDGMGITESDSIDIQAGADCQLLIIEVPLD